MSLVINEFQKVVKDAFEVMLYKAINATRKNEKAIQFDNITSHYNHCRWQDIINNYRMFALALLAYESDLIQHAQKFLNEVNYQQLSIENSRPGSILLLHHHAQNHPTARQLLTSLLLANNKKIDAEIIKCIEEQKIAELSTLLNLVTRDFLASNLLEQPLPTIHLTKKTSVPHFNCWQLSKTRFLLLGTVPQSAIESSSCHYVYRR